MTQGFATIGLWVLRDGGALGKYGANESSCSGSM